MFISCPHKNPLINCIKYGLNQQKSQNKMHEKCIKSENKLKRKGKIVTLAQGERILAKILGENDKKFAVDPCRVGEREKVWKGFEKSDLNKLKTIF